MSYTRAGRLTIGQYSVFHVQCVQLNLDLQGCNMPSSATRGWLSQWKGRSCSSWHWTDKTSPLVCDVTAKNMDSGYLDFDFLKRLHFPFLLWAFRLTEQF